MGTKGVRDVLGGLKGGCFAPGSACVLACKKPAITHTHPISTALYDSPAANNAPLISAQLVPYRQFEALCTRKKPRARIVA
eukprot:8187007-Pyramimonas_sp.AAC.1